MMSVLAFGVLGNADALTFGTTRTGDLQTIVRGNSFSVTFAVNEGTEAVKSAYTNYVVDPDNSNRYFEDTIQDVTGRTDGQGNSLPDLTDRTGVYNSGESTVSVANRSYYNNEAVRISVSGAGARITSIGNNTITPTTSITLKDGGSGAEELVTSVTVNCSTTSHGEITITASDTTPSEDFPSGYRKAPNFVLTVYAVQLDSAVGPTRTIRLHGVTNGVAIGYNDQSNQPIYNGDGSHYPVTYTVSGNGVLYIQEGNRPAVRQTAPLDTSTAAKVLLAMGGSTNTITATLRGSFEPSQGIYIFGNPQLNITVDSNGQSGDPNAALATALEVKLTDSVSAGVVGIPIKFDVTDKSASGGILSEDPDGVGTIVDASNEEISTPRPGSTLYVRTGTDGVANIDFQLGTIPGEQTVTAGTLGIARLTKTFKATARGTDATRQLFAEDIDRHGSTNFYTLVARVENGGQPAAGEEVTFTTTKGLLTGRSSDNQNALTAKTVYEQTNNAGKARVTYNAGDSSGNLEVVASISVGETIITQLSEVTFNVRGGSSNNQQQNQQQNQQNQQQTTGSLEISIVGEGATRSVTVNALAAGGVPVPVPISVVLDGSALGGSTRVVTTGTATEITLPTEPDDYTLTATASVAGYTPDTETLTVAGPTSLGTISITAIGQPSDGAQSFSIRVVDTDGDRISSALTVRLSGSGFTTQNVPTTNGVGNARLTLPTTAALYTLTASAEGYTSGTTQIRVAGTPQDQADEAEEEGVTVGAPDSISIVGPLQRDGTANTELDAPLLVQVSDDNGNEVPEARVIFRVRTGQGRLSERGNGRAVAVQTDANGYARSPYTPISASSTVEAEARGVTRTVTFTITANGGTATPTSTTPRDTDTTSSTISPVVHVAAANRPPMLWVDDGAIYALTGANVQRFIPSVDNALHIAVGGGKVYWTEKTGDSAGTINSAHLDGTGIKELKAIMAVPMGITVDTTANLLYWTNSRGRIQSLNADGSGRVENVLQNLTNPLDIGLAGGNVYWTHGNGGVGFASLKGQKQVRNISNGADAAGSLVIGGGKVYWTEMTGDSGGTIKSANLNGSGVTEHVSIFAVPVGIGLDSARSKLYWTNSRGRIQSSDLEGNGVRNVVDGLGSPGDMVLSNSIAAPAATTTTTTTTADNAKYDVNGDGTVDNMDAGLVSEAMGTSNAKYDVNNDGTVNFLDLLLVFDNRDEGAASAPTVLGMQLSAVQVDVLQEQIDLLIATGDRSPAAMRTLIYLQQLIATARPEQTQLLANYPNPFNPETWIPYELATDTTVTLTIYNTHGAVIRTLQLGHQRTGYYVGRDRAAYWDGRNAFGEQVASGIYFYQLETDAMSLMRKMVILK